MWHLKNQFTSKLASTRLIIDGPPYFGDEKNWNMMEDMEKNAL